MTSADLANILCRHGIIHRDAIEDPEGYDNHATMNAVACAAEEICRIASAGTCLAKILSTEHEPAVAELVMLAEFNQHRGTSPHSALMRCRDMSRRDA